MKGLGELLGHMVDVRSREGRGSVFAIEVPLAPAGVEVVSREVERTGEEAPARGGSILVVEDDPSLRRALERLLRMYGYQPVLAGDGQAAFDLVARQGIRPDFVIADQNLPGGTSGLQVLARLPEILGHHLPALVLTGDISTETIKEIARQGYVSRNKPVGAAELIGLIRSMLAKPT